MSESAPNYREARAEEAPALAAFQLALAQETERLTLDADAVARGVRAVFDDPSKGRWYVATAGRDPRQLSAHGHSGVERLV